MTKRFTARRKKGFSLIELLIVVAIILIIAAIAIPNLIKSKMAANESSAAAMTRTLYTSGVLYSTTYGNGYPVALTNLAPPAAGAATCTNAGDIDAILGAGVKNGYSFKFNGDGLNAAVAGGCAGSINFATGGKPLGANTGTDTFCVWTDGVVYKDPAGGAVPAAAATEPCNGNPLSTN